MSQERTIHAPTASFHDKRIALGNWYEKFRDINVPTPQTQPLPLDHSGEGVPEWDTELAAEIVENLGGEAFIRSDLKSASLALNEGSHIPNTNEEAIDETIAALLSQHLMMEIPLGEQLYLREWLPLNWNAYARETCHPEVRAFIRDGEVVCHHSRLEWRDAGDVPDSYVADAEDLIKRDWNDEIRPLAERVAEKFEGEGWYSVDFVYTTNYRWYCTDMALDALYQRDGEWSGISAHPGDCEHDVEKMTPPENDEE